MCLHFLYCISLIQRLPRLCWYPQSILIYLYSNFLKLQTLKLCLETLTLFKWLKFCFISHQFCNLCIIILHYMYLSQVNSARELRKILPLRQDSLFTTQQSLVLDYKSCSPQMNLPIPHPYYWRIPLVTKLWPKQFVQTNGQDTHIIYLLALPHCWFPQPESCPPWSRTQPLHTGQNFPSAAAAQSPLWLHSRGTHSPPDTQPGDCYMTSQAGSGLKTNAIALRINLAIFSMERTILSMQLIFSHTVFLFSNRISYGAKLPVYSDHKFAGGMSIYFFCINLH